MPGSGTKFHLAVFGALTAVIAWLQFTGFLPLERLELAVQDGLARVGKKAPADRRLVFLAVDSDSTSLDPLDFGMWDLSAATAEEKRALELMATSWPWSREVHGLVLDRLMAAGARVVTFDFTFPKPSPHDAPFRAALERHRDRVVVAGNISEDTEYAVEAQPPTFTPPTETLIPIATPRDPRIAYGNFWIDLDGVIRRADYRWAAEHGVWSSDEEHSLAARTLERADLGERAPAERGAQRVRFAGGPGSFPARSIYKLFVPDYWRRSFQSGEFFRDKIVVVGPAGNWQQDHHHTPFGLMPGAEVHLNAINAALHGTFIRELAPLAQALLVVLAAAVAALTRRSLRRPLVRFAVLLLGTAAWGGIALALYNDAALLVPSVGPLLAFNLNGIGGLALDIALERREKAHVRRTLERYVSRNVVQELIDHPDQYTRALGGDLRRVTILFSDIRGFTRAAATMDSRALVAQLNEYFAAMVECVFRYGGTLDKFIGDAVMAVWGNTQSLSPAADARNAVRCAQAMCAELEKLNAHWCAQGRPQFRIGIGLNSGEVVVGNIGSPHRMEFTVIGDAVNIAWRLQERTKSGPNILLGESVAELLGETFPTEACGDLHLPDHDPVPYARLVDDKEKGRPRPVENLGAKAPQLLEGVTAG
jgi:adenylate cyclase